MTMLFFMSFFLAFDLTLVTYVIAVKLKTNIDYIAINHHIYDITLYRSSYIMLGKRASRKRTEAVRKKRGMRVFKKRTTCANINCGNYGEDIGEKAKTCPLCNQKRYIAEVFDNVITCVNTKCENFGYELNRDIKECSNCGGELKNLALKFRPDLTKPTIIMTAVVTVFFIWVHWAMLNYGIMGGPLVMIITGARYAAYAVCIIRGWASKSKWAFGFAAAAFLFVQFGLNSVLDNLLY
jgi:hypothetical protein